MPRSPKGLITNRSLTPEEMAQLGEQTPNVFQEINEQLAFWRRFAKSYIEPNPAMAFTWWQSVTPCYCQATLINLRSLITKRRSQPGRKAMKVGALPPAFGPRPTDHEIAKWRKNS